MSLLKSNTLSSLFTVSRNFSNSSFGPVMYKSHSHQFGINPPCPGRRTGGPVQFIRQASSVFGQQHQPCERAVRPRDDPELDAIAGVVSGYTPPKVLFLLNLLMQEPGGRDVVVGPTARALRRRLLRAAYRPGVLRQPR